MALFKFVLRRLFLAVVTFLVVTAALYGILMLAPVEARAMVYVPPGDRGNSINLIQTIIDREVQHQAHPDITITIIHSYRGSNAPNPRIESYRECAIRVSDQAFPGRTEYNTIAFEAKGKKRSLITA